MNPEKLWNWILTMHEYHNSCGATLHKMGRYQEALDETRKALELDPDNARVSR